jgi:hypothetical protein
MRAGREDAGLRHPGIDVGLADPDEAFVGAELDDEIVIRRARGRRIVGSREEYVAGDRRDDDGGGRLGR